MSIEPFNRLVKLAARAFYDVYTTKGDNPQKIGRSDNRGIAIVVLDALTRWQWVKEEDLAKVLKLHAKQLRRILRFFEEEKLVTRDHRKETAKVAKMYNAAVAAITDKQTTREGEEKIKLHTQSYCCLDYSQIFDVVRYRLHRMRKKLKDELESKNTVQEYICPNCRKRYTALDALQLISLVDEFFHCEKCDGELVAESDTLANKQEGGDGDDNARRRRREKVKDMVQKMEVQLKPLIDQLNLVKDLDAPEFLSYPAWQSIVNKAKRDTIVDPSCNDPSKFSRSTMPCLGETKVEVAFSAAEDKGDGGKSDTTGSGQKVLPPWMIRQGMNLTEEQRGEVKQELQMDGGSAAQQFVDEKKPNNADDDKKNIQDEYAKAYYAALFKRQQELEEGARKPELSHEPISNDKSEPFCNRKVGMKSKHEEDDREDDVEREEAPTAGNTSESYRVDLNMEAAEASGDDEDDIDWEEG